MKLQHKIAGTILLPLAAAAMTTSVQAADVSVGATVKFHAAEVTAKDGDMDFAAGVGDTRFRVKYADQAKNVSAMYETTVNGTVRHAFVTFDGITAGQTWKPNSTLELLFPTVDQYGNAGTTAPASRAPQLSTKMDLGGGSTLTAGIYDNGNTLGGRATSAQSANYAGGDQVVPSFGAKYAGDMGGLKVVAAFAMEQPAASNGDATNTLTAGVNMDMSGMKVIGAFTNQSGGNKATYMGGAVSMPLGDGMTANVAFETETEGSTNAFWGNVMTTSASGVKMGLEYRMEHDEDTAIDAIVQYDF